MRLETIRLLGLLVGLGATTAGGQTNKVARTASQWFQLGWTAQTSADQTNNSTIATGFIHQAISNYTAAVQVQPDYYQAQLMWAFCLARLQQLELEPKHRQRLTKEGRQRFAAAAKCSGADWAVYEGWGSLLLGAVSALPANSDSRTTTLREAQTLFEEGLKLARRGIERAKLDRDVGLCLVALGDESFDSYEARQFYEQAIARFESAVKTEGEANNPRLYCGWGVALARLGKLDNNRALLLLSVERLRTGLEKDSSQWEAHYNLAGVYALLGQQDNALRHLRICLKHDPLGDRSRAAASDRVFDSLRSSPEFNDLLKPTPSPSVEQIIQPSLSDN